MTDETAPNESADAEPTPAEFLAAWKEARDARPRPLPPGYDLPAETWRHRTSAAADLILRLAWLAEEADDPDALRYLYHLADLSTRQLEALRSRKADGKLPPATAAAFPKLAFLASDAPGREVGKRAGKDYGCTGKVGRSRAELARRIAREMTISAARLHPVHIQLGENDWAVSLTNEWRHLMLREIPDLTVEPERDPNGFVRFRPSELVSPPLCSAADRARWKELILFAFQEFKLLENDVIEKHFRAQWESGTSPTRSHTRPADLVRQAVGGAVNAVLHATR